MLKNTPDTIKNALAEGRFPFMAFEKEILQAELEALGVEQGILGKLLGDAMEQSSETYHDNAPADAVNSLSTVVAKRAETIIAQLMAAVLVDYPDPEEELATIGSIVRLDFDGHGTDTLLLTGLSRRAPELRGAVPEIDDVITVRSPLGLAVIGLSIGDIALYTAGDGDSLHRAKITELHQIRPEYLPPTQI